MNQSHIFKEFDKTMNDLKDNVLMMADLARQNLERAMHALINHDISIARMVIGDDSEVDDLEVRIDQIGMDIFVRFHPVASDLRLVISSMKTAHNLERISDHAVNIAKRAKKICKSSENLDCSIIQPLHSMADSILRDAMQSFTTSNVELARSLKASDKILDAAYKEVVATLSSSLESSGGRAENLLHLILVARSLERVGDLAANIGEDSVFLSEARDIRHEQRKNINSGGE